MTYLRAISVGGAMLVILLAVAACGGYGGEDESENQGSTTIAGMSAELHGTKDVSGESKVEVEMYNDFFEPTILEGAPGQKIMLELKNEGERAHTLTISGQGVDQEVEPDDEAEVEVTFPASGELAFVCRFHENNGMVGALEVSSSRTPSTTTPTTTSSSDY